MGLNLLGLGKKIEDIIGQGLGNVGNAAEQFVGMHPTFNQPQRPQQQGNPQGTINQINQTTGFNNSPVQMPQPAPPQQNPFTSSLVDEGNNIIKGTAFLKPVIQGVKAVNNASFPVKPFTPPGQPATPVTVGDVARQLPGAAVKLAGDATGFNTIAQHAQQDAQNGANPVTGFLGALGDVGKGFAQFTANPIATGVATAENKPVNVPVLGQYKPIGQQVQEQGLLPTVDQQVLGALSLLGGAKGAVDGGVKLATPSDSVKIAATKSAASSPEPFTRMVSPEELTKLQKTGQLPANSEGYTNLINPGGNAKVPSNKTVKVSISPDVAQTPGFTTTEGQSAVKGPIDSQHILGIEHPAPTVTAAETPKVDLATPPPTDTFLTHTANTPVFDSKNFNLESNLNKLTGTHKANQLLLPDMLDSKINPADLEAAYHYAEDKSSPVTPAQKAIYDTHVAPILEQTNGVRNELKGTDHQVSEDYLPRIAQGKNTKYERYLNEQTASPEEGAFRKTTNNDKGRIFHTVTDEQGRTAVASIKAPKDAVGNSTGVKRVTGFQDGKAADFGTLKTKSYDDLMGSEVKPLEAKLAGAKKEYAALQGVRVKGGVSDARMNALARKVAALQDSADALGKPLSKSEKRSVRLATLKGKELGNVKEVTTNVGAKTGKIENRLAYLESAIKQVKDNYDPENLRGRVFIGKDGKRYTIGDATAKQVEAHTNVRYYKNPIASAALAHVNGVNAKAANDFMDAWKRSPDFKDHAVKTENADLTGAHKGWKTVDSPSFKGYYFDPKTKGIIDRLTGGGYTESGNPVIRATTKAWEGMTNIATQFIVINPGVHGGNLYQMATMAAGRFGGVPVARAAEFNASLARLMGDSKFRMQNLQDYLRAGGHFEEYGANHESLISKGLARAGIPEVNKLNARTMAGIDATLRSALFDTAKRAGVDDATAVKQIDDFMGRKESIGPVARAIGMFYHWFVTTTRVGYNLGRHPIQNRGALTNLAVGFAVIQAANYAYQQVTGNPNAHVRNPGEIGYLNDVVKAPGEISQGHVPTTVESHINPLISAIGNQVYAKDLYTGAPVQTAKQRVSNLANKTIMPVQMADRANTGKATPLELAANEALGLYTPHTKGTQAAPNFGPDSPFNTKGATSNTGQAYADQQAHYKVLDQQKAKLADDSGLQNALSNFFTRSHNDQGQSVQLNPADRVSQYKGLLSSDRLLDGVVATEKAGSSHAPSWDLPKDKLSVYVDYQSQYTGDPERTRMMQKYPWLKDAVQADQNFYNGLPKQGNPAPWQPTAQQQSDLQSYGYSMGDAKYPTFDSQTQSDLNAYNNLTDPKARGDFLSSHPNVATAFGQIGRYTNASRIVEGALPTQDYPEESAHVKAVLASMPQGADKASAAARAKLIQGNSDVNQYMANVSLYNTTKDLAGYYLKINPKQDIGQELNNGSAESQQVLKGITSLGQYDIGPTSGGKLAFSQGGSLPQGSNSQVAYNKQKAARASSRVSSSSNRVARNALRRSVTRSNKIKLQYGTSKWPNRPFNYGVGSVSSGKPKRIATKGVSRPRVSLKQNVS